MIKSEGNDWPPRRILAPIDCSPASFYAWDMALDLAKRLSALLQALYVYEPALIGEPTATFGCLPLTDEIEGGLRRDLAQRLGQGASLTIVQGFPAEEILRFAGQAGSDLIVMGTHGRSGLSRVLFGSVAEAVVRRSPVPVLTVRRPCRPIRRMLASLGAAPGAAPSLRAAARLAEALEAKLDVVRGEPLETLRARARGYDLVAASAAARRLRRGSEEPVLAIPDRGSGGRSAPA